jgi:hypothetical protein
MLTKDLVPFIRVSCHSKISSLRTSPLTKVSFHYCLFLVILLFSLLDFSQLTKVSFPLFVPVSCHSAILSFGLLC